MNHRGPKWRRHQTRRVLVRLDPTAYVRIAVWENRSLRLRVVAVNEATVRREFERLVRSYAKPGDRIAALHAQKPVRHLSARARRALAEVGYFAERW